MNKFMRNLVTEWFIRPVMDRLVMDDVWHEDKLLGDRAAVSIEDGALIRGRR